MLSLLYIKSVLIIVIALYGCSGESGSNSDSNSRQAGNNVAVENRESVPNDEVDESDSEIDTSENDSSSPVPNSELVSENSGSPFALAGIDDRDAHNAVVFESEDINEIRSLQIFMSSVNNGKLLITCREGSSPSYLYDTDSVTENGRIDYRIGRGDVVSELWNESSDFEFLFPPFIDENLFKNMYPETFFRFDWREFRGGIRSLRFNLSGFPALIDQTREICDWDENIFPFDNRWGKEIPVSPPADAKISNVLPGRSELFRTIAWIDENSSGENQLLLRVGDYEGEGPCEDDFLVGERFYVRQHGKLIPITRGFDKSFSCSKPYTYALQGNFDVDSDFKIEIYPFFLNALKPEESAQTKEPGGHFSEIIFSIQ